MDPWQNEPPSADSIGGVRLVRTPASHPLRGVILSDDLVGRPTHYDGTRTVPCEGPRCDLCSKGLPWRWHGYLALWCPTIQERVILELTAQASQRIAEHRRTYGNLRGFDLTANRPRGKPNSRVALLIGTKRQPEHLLPPAPDVPRIMTYIWGTDQRASQLRPRPVEPDPREPPARQTRAPDPQTPTGNGIGLLPPN